MTKSRSHDSLAPLPPFMGLAAPQACWEFSRTIGGAAAAHRMTSAPITDPFLLLASSANRS